MSRRSRIENRRQNHIAELDQHKFSLKCLFEEGKFGTKANFIYFIMASEAKAERGMLWGEQEVQALIDRHLSRHRLRSS